MNRRSILVGIGAALAAPAIVKASSLMKIAVVRQSAFDEGVYTPIIEWDLGGSVMYPAPFMLDGKVFWLDEASHGFMFYDGMQWTREQAAAFSKRELDASTQIAA